MSLSLRVDRHNTRTDKLINSNVSLIQLPSALKVNSTKVMQFDMATPTFIVKMGGPVVPPLTWPYDLATH